jgi:EAL domain-containing protein (putative c-di-GMP-specific phosphodiesterase class I)
VACRIAINASVVQLRHPAFAALVSGALKRHQVAAERLEIEVTESVLLDDNQTALTVLHKLQSEGVTVALDDFGAGYTSFRNLKAIAVDSVKIDGSFVRGVADNVDNQLFIRTLLGLAEGFGLETVAECVENNLEAQHLAKRGVNLLQGNLFGLPSIERPWLAPLGLDALSAKPARPNPKGLPPRPAPDERGATTETTEVQ